MKFYTSIITVTFMLLFTQVTFAQRTVKKVLFFGNSYTGGLPERISDLASSVGDSLIFKDASAGQTIKDHATSPNSFAAIAREHWDYVVIQCQSQEGAWRDSYVNANVFPYAKILADSVKHYNPCTKTMFYMTWGRKNGDASNCSSYPPVCTFEGMQTRLRTNYLKMGFDNDAFVCPVGMAWRHARTNYPNIELYDADESHPSQEGMYLTASTFYAAIFEKSPIPVTYTGGLNQMELDSLKKAADFIVFDSLATWNIKYSSRINGVVYSVASDTVQFTFNNTSATSATWDFGDGNQSQQYDPMHIYGKADTFFVSLSASGICNQFDTSFNVITTMFGDTIGDTTKDTTITKPNEILELEYSMAKVYPNPSIGELHITLDISDRKINGFQFKLYNTNGVEVMCKPLIADENSLDLSSLNSGVYYYSIVSEHQQSIKQKLILLD